MIAYKPKSWKRLRIENSKIFAENILTPKAGKHVITSENWVKN